MSFVKQSFDRQMGGPVKRRRSFIEVIADLDYLAVVLFLCVLAASAAIVERQESGTWVPRNPVTHCAPRGGVLTITDHIIYCNDGTDWAVTYYKEAP